MFISPIQFSKLIGTQPATPVVSNVAATTPITVTFRKTHVIHVPDEFLPSIQKQVKTIHTPGDLMTRDTVHSRLLQAAEQHHWQVEDKGYI